VAVTHSACRDGRNRRARALTGPSTSPSLSRAGGHRHDSLASHPLRPAHGRRRPSGRGEDPTTPIGWSGSADFAYVLTTGNSESSTLGFKTTVLHNWGTRCSPSRRARCGPTRPPSGEPPWGPRGLRGDRDRGFGAHRRELPPDRPVRPEDQRHVLLVPAAPAGTGTGFPGSRTGTWPRRGWGTSGGTTTRSSSRPTTRRPGPPGDVIGDRRQLRGVRLGWDYIHAFTRARPT